MKMLEQYKVEYLCSIAGFDPVWHDGFIIGFKNNNKFSSEHIKIPYEEFKRNMGLNDIRFHWMASDNAYISGGAVLAWIWTHAKNSDVDFFFTNVDSGYRFDSLIRSFGLVETKDLYHRTKTYEYNDCVKIQLVGVCKDINDTLWSKYSGNYIGKPFDVISEFDISVCKFAIDSDYLYTTRSSISDLLSREIPPCISRERAKKYINKGFLQTLYKFGVVGSGCVIKKLDRVDAYCVSYRYKDFVYRTFGSPVRHFKLEDGRPIGSVYGAFEYIVPSYLVK